MSSVLASRRFFAAAMLTLTGFFSPSLMALEPGDLAPDFTLPSIHEDGTSISLADFRGKAVYVDFWASWCAPCLRSLPLINELYARYREQGLEVIAINVDNRIEDGQDFLLDIDLDYLIPIDADNEVLQAYEVMGMPTSFLVDPEGIIRKVHIGFREGDIGQIESAIKAVLPDQ
ncbi:MAG: TlpA disulfide reductase family protein [Pseudomonadales bacterium]|nr:TlpA disulfide reductase family protein [Pseudomonadales bacterium]